MISTKRRRVALALALGMCISLALPTFALSSSDGKRVTVGGKSDSKTTETSPKRTQLSSGNVTLLAGGKTRGNRDGTVADSLLSEPMGLAIDKNGVVYFCDSANGKIRTIRERKISTYAGLVTPKNIYGVSVGGFVDGDAKTTAVFSRPTDIKVGGDAAFIVDSGNHAVRVILNGKVSTLAGNGKPGYKDGAGGSAAFNAPTSIVFGDNGMMYVSDTQNHVIRAIDSSGNTTTVAGTPMQAGYSDGAARSSMLCEPKGLCFSDGTLYIADSGNQRIRALKNGVLSTVAGSGKEKFPESHYYVGGYRDGDAKAAAFSNPSAICAGTNGTLYIADTNNGAVRKLSNGKVTTLLKSDVLDAPEGIARAGSKLIVSDSFNNKVISIAAK